MAQVYGIPRGRVADIPGAIAGGTQYELQQDAISEQQKQQNTQWLAGAAKYGLDNWGQEGILEQLVTEGQRRGILGPQLNAADLMRGGKGELIKVYQGAMTALGGPPPQDNKDSSLIKEYKFAQGNGYKGSFQEFRMSKPAGVQVTNQMPAQYPAPQPGYMYEFGPKGAPTGMVAIPGGPADIKQREAEEKARNLQEQTADAAAMVNTDIDRIFQRTGPAYDRTLPATGGFAGMAANIPIFGGQTAAGQIEDLLFGIKGRIGMNELQQMRNNSPTGGALGQVSEKEIDMLQSLMGKLNYKGDPALFAYNLARVRNGFNKVIHGKGNYKAWLAPEQAYKAIYDDPNRADDFEAKFGYLPLGFREQAAVFGE